VNDARSLNELRVDIVEYLWRLHERGKGQLHQRGMALALGTDQRRIGDAMTGSRIQIICEALHPGYRVRVRRTVKGWLYHVSDNCAPLDSKVACMRWRQRISKGRRLTEEFQGSLSNPIVVAKVLELLALLDWEEKIVSEIEQAAA
jgi:hypothetical protein